MEENLEREGIEHLERIEDKLDEIKEREPNHRTSFINGIWQGAGALIGGVIALSLLGWILSAVGIIPGLGDIAHALQEAAGKFGSRY